MFTGLVETMGTVTRVMRDPGGASFHIDTTFQSLVLGESIAIDGTCLTVASVTSSGFIAQASSETLGRTTLGTITEQSKVHMERAMRADTRLGGHLVSGHVDGVGTLVERRDVGDSEFVVFEVPARLAPFMAPKGSVCVSGVSLTVNGVKGTRFDVVLVPHTRIHTKFDSLPVGAPVNIEVDVLAKYVASLLGRPGVDG